MIAIDTNVVVRLVVADDPRQTAAARRLLEAETVMVCTTVLLESEWVLRSAYGLSQERACKALKSFCGLSAVCLNDEERVAQAFDLCEGGMDFADALHVAAAVGSEAFATFDRALRKKAGQEFNGVKIRVL